MSTFSEDITTIRNAVYGKEMRPAIADALWKCDLSLDVMMGAVNTLNERVDELISGGGDDGGDTTLSSSGAYVATRAVEGGTTSLIMASYATVI